MKINYNIDYYGILELKHDFDKSDLKKSYRNLSKKYHPDKNINKDNQDEIQEYFKLIAEANSVLSNEYKRKKYDKESKYGKSYDPFIELSNFEFSNKDIAAIPFNDKMKKFKSKELRHIIFKLDEFIENIEYTKYVMCGKCNGKGVSSIMDNNLFGKMGSLFDDDDIECDICSGSGIYNGNDCPSCHGSGKFNFGLSECASCQGDGVVSVKAKLKLEKDNFIDNKYMLKFGGNYDKYLESTGNLYIIIDQ